MISIKDMRVGDVFVHKTDENLAWLVFEVKHEEGLQGWCVRYRCLDLIEGKTQWATNELSAIIDESWELLRA